MMLAERYRALTFSLHTLRKMGSTNRNMKKRGKGGEKSELDKDALLSRRFGLLLRSNLIQKLNRPCIINLP